MATFDVMVCEDGQWRIGCRHHTVRAAQRHADIYRHIGYDTVYIHGHWER